MTTNQQTQKHDFADRAGRTWNLRPTVADFKRVKDATGVEMGRLHLDGWRPLGQLLEDVVTFVDVLFVLVEQQANDLGVTSEQFGGSLDGSTLEQAADAFIAALADFNPPGRRQTLLALTARWKEIRDTATALILQQLNDITPE